jgi:2-C-methyl-D-erythritol 4-phosphate cytidylyltransferase
MNKWLIVAGAGSGTRMQNELPKQFKLLKDKPILVHTIEKFINAKPEIKIILALNISYFNWIEENSDNFPILKKLTLCKGGTTRFETVKNALELISDGLVAIHDAVRPFVSENLINDAFEEASKFGNAIPCIALNESLRKLEKMSSEAVNRQDYRIIQTPQVFDLIQLKTAYMQAYSAEFTDDASVVEAANYPIHLINGEVNNIKLTYPIDFKLAELIIS